MTISTQSNRADFTGNGSATNFPFSFKAFDASDIRVVRTNSTTGESVTLASPSDYTVALTSSGGSVTLSAALATGFRLSVLRVVPTTQTTAVPNQGPFPAETIEERFDRLAAAVQQVDERSKRAFRLDDADVDPATGEPSVSPVLSSKAFFLTGSRGLGLGPSGFGFVDGGDGGGAVGFLGLQDTPGTYLGLSLSTPPRAVAAGALMLPKITP